MRRAEESPDQLVSTAAEPSGSDESAVEGAVHEEVPGLPYLPITPSKREVSSEAKPLWRGWIHAATLPLAIASGIVLIALAQGAAAKWACAVFMTTSILLFGNSALYHRFNWGPRMKVTLKRIDHSNIFLLIAGTYTPIAVLCLPHAKATLLLSLVWAGAIVGICFRVFWVTAPRWLYVPIYVLLGWAAVMYLGDFVRANVATMILIVAGGLAYTVGAVIYGLKRPNPVPGVFGFHEIFHSLTVVAFACHCVAIFLVALNPPVLG